MELDLKSSNDGLVIRWNGKLVTEIGPTGPAHPEEYEADVRRGRIAYSFAMLLEGVVRRAAKVGDSHDHVNAKPDARRAAYLRGFSDGAAGRTVEHPFKGVPPMTPEHSPSYAVGYADGETVTRCIKMIREVGGGEGGEVEAVADVAVEAVADVAVEAVAVS